MSTHTPGPWTLGKSCDGFRTVTDGTKTICTVGEADLFPEIEHDAALIAAAPELLEACRRCFERLTDNDIITMGSYPLTQLLAHAVATAEGRA